MKISTNIKTTLNTAGLAFDAIKNISTGAYIGSDGLFATDALKAYTTQLSGLTATQQKMALMTTNLTAAQRQQVLSYMAETAAAKTLTAQQLIELSADQKRALIDAGIITGKQARTGATITLTKAELRKIIADKAILTKDKQLILSAFGVTEANLTEASSWEILGKSMGKWLFTTPAGWATLAIGAVVGLTVAYANLASTAESAAKAQEELKEAESDLASARDELTGINDKIAEIKSKGGELGISDQAELDRLETERAILEDQVRLLELKKELAADKSNREAVKAVTGNKKEAWWTDSDDKIIRDTTGYTDSDDDGNFETYSGQKSGSVDTTIGGYEKEIEEIEKEISEWESKPDSEKKTNKLVKLREKKQAVQDKITENKDKLIDIYLRDTELMGQITGDDPASVAAREKLQKEMDFLEQYIYTKEQLAKIKFDDFIKDPNNKAVSEGFKDIQKDGEVTAQEITDLANKFPALSKYMSENGITAEVLAEEYSKVSDESKKASENANEMTDLSKFKTASENVSELQKVFKELSDDGYITTDTISSIKKAVGDSIDNWEEYEKVLMTAKAGSAEFNKAMSDMTYAMVERTIGTDDLAEADVNYIAHILEENGVLNANAVAHDMVTVAKEKSLIASSKSAVNYLYENLTLQELTDATNETIETKLNEAGISTTLEQREYALAQARAWAALKAYDGTEASYAHVSGLLSECGSAAVTEQAMIGLKNAQDIYNISTLDVSQKVGALQELGYFLQHDLALMQQMSNTSITYSDGKWWVNAWDENGNWLGADEYHGFDYTPPEITVPQYSGGSSKGSSSDKNEALDNYLKYAEDIYKVHQDETKYINDIQWAYDNLAKTQEEQAEIAEKIEQARRAYAENRIKDLEHENELLEQAGGTEEQRIANLQEMQRIREEEADRYRTWMREQLLGMGYTDEDEISRLIENSDFIQDQQKGWWSDQDKILDIYDNLTNSQIDDIKHQIELNTNNYGEDFNNNAYYKQIQEIAHAEAERLRALNPEKYKEQIQEWQNVWWDAEQAMLDFNKKIVDDFLNQLNEKLDDTYDIRISRLNSESSLLSAHYGVLNAINEEQHNLNKELLEAETIGARMNEQERETLFTKQEHTRLSGKLNDIMLDITDLQSDYQHDLATATQGTIEEITNNYERQYELKMKEYEIVRAELDLMKKRQILENVENEKSVRTWNGSNWVYEANLQDVLDAQEELANAEYELAKAKTEEAQQLAIDALDIEADALQTEKNKFATAIDEMAEKMDGSGKRITDMLKTIAETDLPTFDAIIQDLGGSLKEAFGIKDEDINKYRTSSMAGRGGSSGLSSEYVSWAKSQMEANGKAWHSADADGKVALEKTNQSLGAIIGSTYDEASGTWKHKYATGTKNAHKGVGLFDEEGLGSEFILTNDGVLTQFQGGEHVFSPEMADRLWEMAKNNPILPNIPSVNNVDTSRITTIEERINNAINNAVTNNAFGDTYYNTIKDLHVNDSNDAVKGFINFLKKKI